MIITVQRIKRTVDGLFGVMNITDEPFICYTVENLEKAIPAGEYDMNFTYSNRFQRIMPHIIVPCRDKDAGGDAGIRIHSANYPSQLQGCIAVGDKIDGNAVDDSRDTFVKLMKVIQDKKDIKIIVKDIKEDYFEKNTNNLDDSVLV